VRAYLGVLAHHRAVDAVRAATRRRRAETAAFDIAVVSAAFEDEVLGESARSWCRERLDAALDALPEEQRAAIVLAYFGGRTYKDVAVALGIPEGTAKSRIRIGLARVRDLVGDDLRAER
jgi:RNA polymerase sigma-70 factor (ECF subfamily)